MLWNHVRCYRTSATHAAQPTPTPSVINSVELNLQRNQKGVAQKRSLAVPLAGLTAQQQHNDDKYCHQQQCGESNDQRIREFFGPSA